MNSIIIAVTLDLVNETASLSKALRSDSEDDLTA